ncbi:MAG: hypothetical protein J5709_02205 [Bacteroidales bacterium]|nr:hypothetical protein [Bacteroidales bacterium]
MKKLVLIIAIAIASLAAFGQNGYVDFETLGDIQIKTKLAHAKAKDASSPIELSLFFQNTGTTEVIVCYELYIEDEESGEIRHSGHKKIKVRPGQKQMGKISNLTYELVGTKIEDYTNGKKRWYFKSLQIKDAVTDEVIATSSKTEE